MEARSYRSPETYHKPKKSVQGIFPLTPGIPLANLYSSQNRDANQKPFQKQFMYCNTPVEAGEVNLTERKYRSVNPLPSPYRRNRSLKKNNTASTVDLHSNLKPISKEELDNIFEKYKQRCNRRSEVVEEVSEINEKTLVEGTPQSKEKEKKPLPESQSQNQRKLQAIKPVKRPMQIKVNEIKRYSDISSSGKGGRVQSERSSATIKKTTSEKNTEKGSLIPSSGYINEKTENTEKESGPSMMINTQD